MNIWICRCCLRISDVNWSEVPFCNKVLIICIAIYIVIGLIGLSSIMLTPDEHEEKYGRYNVDPDE